MASTLIKRICDPAQMTEQEQTDVMVEKGYATTDDLKLRLHAMLAVMLEIHKGRMSANMMMTWLTAAEFTDAGSVLSDVQSGTFTQDAVKKLCLLAESKIYTCAQVETILGL